MEQEKEQSIEQDGYFTAPDGSVWVSEGDYNLWTSSQLADSQNQMAEAPQMGMTEPQPMGMEESQTPEFGMHR